MSVRPFRNGAGLAIGGAVLAVAIYLGYKVLEDPANQLFGKTIVSGPSNERVVALTYDDGPNPPYTERILDVLERERVHATFFVVGRAVRAYPHVVAREVRDGDAVGNHTWTHAHLVILTPVEMRREMQRTSAALWSAARVRTNIMRPPFGSRDWIVLQEMHKEGYAVVMWSVPLPKDWEYPSAATIARRILPMVRDGSIIVLHDGNRGQLCGKHVSAHVCDRTQDIAATEMIVDALKRQGYRFVTIPELMALHKPTRKPVRESE